jgi:predicted HTH domain antitoxin
MTLTIPDEVLHEARMTEEELRGEIAVVLFSRERLTLAQAARLAGLPRIEFQRLLASREIPIHYDVEDFRQDMATLERVGLL